MWNLQNLLSHEISARFFLCDHFSISLALLTLLQWLSTTLDLCPVSPTTPTKIETTFEEDTVWLSIDQMAELFQRDKSTISRHIKNIFEEGELQRISVVANCATTATDGKTYNVDYYNLDVIISVGYRVKSHRGTQFRIWAMS